ncbi:interferon-inducible GTPase 1-like isoform X2 [Arvicola amphibius]|uniref:interferon-inducible GTPase 1-like isoform X2 n=1 Tax=Arvicola amphibius TaxID=1047088 RepID=UPI0018E3EA4B|nr:interferon-inducible GTPase 1-like isoform X2 [Arvicola amphibius]
MFSTEKQRWAASGETGAQWRVVPAAELQLSASTGHRTVWAPFTTAMGKSSSKDERHGDLESSFTLYFKKFKTESKIIPQETIDSIELYLTKGNIQGANSVISAALKNIDNVPINVAVTGESGAGKSSLINALRGVGPEDKDAADIGVVETTMRRTAYKHPKIQTLTLWDLPGVGTLNFPPKDYLEKVNFQEYDFFIIVSATRFTKLELDLAKAIKFMKKNYYFVRTKVDNDLQNEKKSKARTFDRKNILLKIRNSYIDTLKENGLDAPEIFLISNSNLSDYDFPVLMDTLVKTLPAQKRHSFMLSLPNITEATIDKKHKSMQQTIWLEAFKTGLFATVPVVGILRDDVEKVKEKLNHYRVLFGVDDASLQVIAKDSQVPAEQLKKIIKSPYLLDTKKRETLEEKLLKYLERFASVNGGLLATGLYFRKTFYLQLLLLDTVAEDAKVVLRETYSKISSNSCHPQLLTMDKCYSFLMFLIGFVVVFFILSYLRLWAWDEV